jgi:TRAP-type C4-dicarboxylate transport system substrate-binding protein
MSGGRMQMEVFPAGSVIPEMEMFDGIRAGVADMAMCSIGKWKGRIGPMADFQYNIPGGLREPREGEVFMFDMGVEEMFQEIMEPFNMYYLANVAVIQGDVLVSANPVPDVASLEGMIVRAMGPLEITFSNCGAKTTTLPVGELYMALDTGAIDGCEWGNAEMMYAAGLHEVAKYWVWPPIVPFATNNMVINLDSWKALPADLQAIVEVGNRDSIRASYRESQKADTEVFNIIQEQYGVTVHNWSEAEQAKWSAAARPMLADMAAEDPVYAAKAVKLFEDYMVFLGYWD